jgi:L-amino acid N-acyltransferase YncA
MNLTIEFIPAKESDLEKIVGTYNASIPGRMATADLEPVSVESKMEWFQQHNPETRPILLIQVDEKYAGWLSFSSFYGRPAYQGTAEISIYLENQFQGKGIGRRGILYAEKIAPPMGIANLLAFVFAHNAPSMHLFLQQGFQKWAHFPGIAKMDDIHRDLIILGKKL